MHGNEFDLLKPPSPGPTLPSAGVKLCLRLARPPVPTLNSYSLASPPRSALDTRRTNHIMPAFPVHTGHKRPKIHRSSSSQQGFMHTQIRPHLCQRLNSPDLSTVTPGALRISGSVESLYFQALHRLHLFTTLKPLRWGQCFPSPFQIIVTPSPLKLPGSSRCFDFLWFKHYDYEVPCCSVRHAEICLVWFFSSCCFLKLDSWIS